MQSSPQRKPTKCPVREATWSDSPDIAGLLGELGYPSSAPFVRDRLGKLSSFAHSPVFVVEHDDKIVGFLSFHIIPLFNLMGGSAELPHWWWFHSIEVPGLVERWLKLPSASHGAKDACELK
jgi:hypothetical protein